MSDDELLHNMSRAFWASNGGSDNSMRAVLDVLHKAGYRRCAEGQRVTQWCDRAEKAEAEVERLREDAERYRWLRGEVHGPHVPLAQVLWKFNNIRDNFRWTNLSDGQTLDEHIDAARGES